MDPEEQKKAEEAAAAAAANAKKLQDDTNAELKKLESTVNTLADSVKALAGKLEEATKSKPEAKPIADAAKNMIASVEALIEDKTVSLEEKNK